MHSIGPFDNGSLDQYLIANNSSEADQVTLIARTRAGDEMCRGSFKMQPASWYKVPLSESPPCLAGKLGALEVRSDRGNVAAMLFLMTTAGEAIPLHPGSSVEDTITEVWSQLKKRAGVTWLR